MYIRENRREREIIDKYKKRGYEVLTKGWPDLLLHKNGKVIAIEVKRKQKRPSKKMGLSKHQKRCHEILRIAGIKVLVLYVE